jgi:TrmH family RNA methyltransferase
MPLNSKNTKVSDNILVLCSNRIKSLLSKVKIKQYQQLQFKKFRQKYGLFVVEGLKSVNELIQTRWPIESIVCSTSFKGKIESIDSLDLFLVKPKEFETISQQKNPQGILAIAQFHKLNLEETPWQIALENINNPGNLGTIIRIADWYGINTIYCSQDTVDLYNSKVIQSSMGSFLRVQLKYGKLPETLNQKDIYATKLNGKNIRTLPKMDRGVLLIGNEANGISKPLSESLAHTPITIPGNIQTESLNAAMATAICCERLLG